MNNREKKAGLIAGISLLIMALAAGFSYGFVHNKLIADSAEITQQNILENKTLFLTGLAGWLLIFLTDLIVSWKLFVFFKRTHKTISLGTAIIRTLYTLILGIAIVQLFAIVPFISKNGAALKIKLLFESFAEIWSAGLIIFGFHLIGLGYLAIKSSKIHRAIGYLISFSGVAYVFIHAAKSFNVFTAETLTRMETILSVPMGLSEILLAIIILYKALKN